VLADWFEDLWENALEVLTSWVFWSWALCVMVAIVIVAVMDL
jgi:hypothetical protein